MEQGGELLALLVGATAVAGTARRLKLSAPIALVVAGLAVSLLPGIPEYTLHPDLVLLLFLPPLLYSAALGSSYIGFRANLRPIGLLSVGLVLFTTAVVGLVVHAVVPDLPLAAAFALGAIVAPPDAVAATAIGRSVGMSRRAVTILGGESLVNDATALTAYRVAIGAAVGGGFSLLDGIQQFVVAAVGGVGVGLVLAPPLHRLLQQLHDPLLENAIGLLIPFVAYLTAEQIHASGVLSVVVVGLYLGHHAPTASFATRLQGAALWRVVDFLLESVVFALIGLQLRRLLDSLDGYGFGEVGWAATAVTLTVIVTRFVWVYPSTYLPRMLSRRLRNRDPAPPWQVPAIIGWAGMRGVVSLAAAFAIPLQTDAGTPFPARDLLLFLTFCVILATLVLQGFTLPAVVRLLRHQTSDSFQDDLAEAAAQQAAARAALTRLDSLLDEADEPPPDGVVERLRARAEYRQLGAWERLGGGPTGPNRDTPTAVYSRLRREMLAAERDVFIRLRNEKRIDDEVMRRVIAELDLEEAMLDRE